MTDEELIERVAWALHCWGCPLCFVNGIQSMGESDQDHVTELDLNQASFLIGALGLVAAEALTGGGRS